MDYPSIAKAVASASPDVNALLARHARWSAQMCRNVPSPVREMCQNPPSHHAERGDKDAGMCQNLPEPATNVAAREKCGTNPPIDAPLPPAHPLSERQLLAARMIVSGYRTTEIAGHLRVNRHTVAVWRRNPMFRVELDRLHACATAAMVSELAQTAVPRRPVAPPPPQSRRTRAEIEQEERECEALIEQLLRAKAARDGR